MTFYVKNLYHPFRNKLFYKDATVYLERKKKTFEVAVSISNSKIKYRKKQ